MNTLDETLLRQALDALVYHREQTRPIEGTDKAIAALEARLKFAPVLEICHHRQGRADWHHWQCAGCGWIRPGGPTRGPDEQGFFPSMEAVKEYDKFRTYPGMGEVLPMVRAVPGGAHG